MRICPYKQLCGLELQWFSSFVLLDFSSLVLLVFIICFVFQETMALRPKLVVFVDDINEGSRDVAFENKVLCRYGNWNTSKEHKFPYLHYDLIDRAGFYFYYC